MPAKKTTRKPAKKAAAKSKVAVRKTVAKKAPAKKVVKKVAKKVVKKVAKKATKSVASKVAAKKPATVKAISNKLTSAQLYQLIAERTELSKKQVLSVFDELSDIMEGCLKKRGVGEFALPKLAKFTVKAKPATKQRPGVNPFTGENIIIKAKPARRIVKVRPLKKVKDMAE